MCPVHPSTVRLAACKTSRRRLGRARRAHMTPGGEGLDVQRHGSLLSSHAAACAVGIARGSANDPPGTFTNARYRVVGLSPKKRSEDAVLITKTPTRGGVDCS